jgi:hypothetical protein
MRIRSFGVKQILLRKNRVFNFTPLYQRCHKRIPETFANKMDDTGDTQEVKHQAENNF